MTQSRPLGTVTWNLIDDGALPGWMYCSLSGMLLTVTRPCVSQHLTVSLPTATTRLIRSFSLLEWQRPCVAQHLTVSPPTATTRLIMSFSLSEGCSPMNCSPSLTCLITTGASCLTVFCSSSSQPPGSLNTTTSPRCGSETNHGVSL